jgi:hypothetical protein
MKSMKQILLALIVFLTIASCKESNVLTSYCTNVEGIFKLHDGMTLDEISAALNVQPTDFYYALDDKYEVVTYTYRRNYQLVLRDEINDEASLRGGSSRYKDEQTLFVILDANTKKMIYYITEPGRKKAAKEINYSLLYKLKK